MALIINIHDIREAKSAQIHGKLEIAPIELDLPRQNGVDWQAFSLDYTVINAGTVYVLQGTLECGLIQECSRCLKPVNTQLCVDIQEQFSRLPFEGEDEETHRFYGDEIDVSGALRENILLNLPAKPLCFPDCRGLCPHCGIDRNVESCQCSPKSVDPRLAILEKLISK